MKIKLLLLLVWSSPGAFAQTKPDSSASYKEKADYVLAQLLARGAPPSGILTSRVISFSGAERYTKDSIRQDTLSGLANLSGQSTQSISTDPDFEWQRTSAIPDCNKRQGKNRESHQCLSG